MKSVPLLLCVVTFALAQPESATVKGRVTDTSGNPVAKATLLLSGSPQPGAPPFQSYRATTASDGTYTFIGIDPGSHTLQAMRAGYVEYRGNLRLTAGQQMNNFNVTLTPANSITGRVTDENGDPVSGVVIQLWRQNRAPDGSVRMAPGIPGQQSNYFTTDNSGHYKIPDIPPGIFYLSAGSIEGGQNPDGRLFDIVGLRLYSTNFGAPPRPGQRQQAYRTTWYPGAIDSSISTPVQIAAGRTVSDIDIQLRKTSLYNVRGKAVNLPGPARIQVVTNSGQPIPGILGEIAKDGSFEQHGIAPGDYYLEVFGATMADRGTLALQKFTVADADVASLLLNIPAPAEIHGTLTVNGKPPVQTLTVSLTGTEGPAFLYGFQTGKVGSDGTFTIPRIIPGPYRIKVGVESSGAPIADGAYMTSARLNGTEVADSAFNLAAGSSTLQIAYGSATGAVRVNVTPDAHGVSAQFVVIVPEPNTPGVTWRYRELGTPGNGVFFNSELPPGTYRIYALGSVDRNTFDPATLQQYESQSVKVTVTGSEPVVTTVPTITAQ